MTVEVKSVEDLFTEALNVPAEGMEAFCRALSRADAAALYRLAGKKEESGHTPDVSRKIWWILLNTKARWDNHIR